MNHLRSDPTRIHTNYTTKKERPNNLSRTRQHKNNENT